jgi:hypothetical protein
MNLLRSTTALAVAALISGLSGAALASDEEKEAKKLCKHKIQEVYGARKFRENWVEQVGNHKFKVHGQAVVEDYWHSYDCKVKNGSLKSYSYDGPARHHSSSENDDDSKLGTAIAVGAGVAILAALASQSGEDDRRGESTPDVKKSVLEDDCHDILQYRIRDEHDRSARVKMQDSAINGHDLKGEAKVKYDHGRPHHASYTCHFDRHGRIVDSSYYLY